MVLLSKIIEAVGCVIADVEKLAPSSGPGHQLDVPDSTADHMPESKINGLSRVMHGQHDVLKPQHLLLEVLRVSRLCFCVSDVLRCFSVHAMFLACARERLAQCVWGWPFSFFAMPQALL
jgi:hypothetical protein